jgi:hypothetical protein
MQSARPRAVFVLPQSPLSERARQQIKKSGSLWLTINDQKKSITKKIFQPKTTTQ